jgi:hypothetical protein
MSYDSRIEIRANRSQIDALDETIPDDVDRSTYLRRAIDRLIDEDEDEIADDVLDRARRERFDRIVDEDVAAATFRKRTRNLAKSLSGSDLTASEIEYGFRHKYDEARHLPDELRPDDVVEYIDCLLVLVRLFETSDTHRDLFAAFDKIDAAYPEDHVDEARDMILDVGIPEDDVDRLDEATRNGILEPVRIALEGDEDDADDEDEARATVGGSRDRSRRDDEDDQDPNPFVKTDAGKIRSVDALNPSDEVVEILPSGYDLEDIEDLREGS